MVMTIQPTDKELAGARLVRCLTAMMNTATEGDAYILKEAIAALRTARQSDERTVPVIQHVYLTDSGAVVTGIPQRGWDEDGEHAHNCDSSGCGQEHAIARVPFTDERKPATPASASEPIPLRGLTLKYQKHFDAAQFPPEFWTDLMAASGEGQQGDVAGFLRECAGFEGKMVSGNHLSRRARVLLSTQQQAGQAVYQQKDDFGLWRDTDKANHDWWRDHSSTPDEVRTLYTSPQAPDGMLSRIEAAIQRIKDGHACMRVPADPTDPDLVLAEVMAHLKGHAPPFWIAASESSNSPASHRREA